MDQDDTRDVDQDGVDQDDTRSRMDQQAITDNLYREVLCKPVSGSTVQSTDAR